MSMGRNHPTLSTNFLDLIKTFADNQDFQILIDGQVVGTFTPDGAKYKQYSTGSFTVSAGSHILAFQGLDSKGIDARGNMNMGFREHISFPEIFIEKEKLPPALLNRLIRLTAFQKLLV